MWSHICLFASSLIHCSSYQYLSGVRFAWMNAGCSITELLVRKAESLLELQKLEEKTESIYAKAQGLKGEKDTKEKKKKKRKVRMSFLHLHAHAHAHAHTRAAPTTSTTVAATTPPLCTPIFNMVPLPPRPNDLPQRLPCNNSPLVHRCVASEDCARKEDSTFACVWD